ncbi:TPA: YbhB/YbcL family Raf kinase inhibitor-like protein [Neisseria meningitidis]
MQTRILSAVLLAFSTAAFAEGAFTLQFDNPSKDGGFTQNQLLSAPYGFGCSGGNASPALSWKNPPAGTKSFVLTVYDKDAPTGLGWMHWVVADIPADVRRRNAASLQLSRCANIADDQPAAISAVISLRICRIRLTPSYTAKPMPSCCNHANTPQSAASATLCGTFSSASTAAA